MNKSTCSPTNSRRRFLALAPAGGLCALGFYSDARAQPVLAGTARVLCGTPAGSTVDVVARRFAEAMKGSYAPQVVVENRPGAAGHLAVNALKLAAPDGSTLLLSPNGVATIHPYTYPKLAYDPVADLQPVSLAAESDMALAVGPAVPATVGNLAQLVAWMRRNPGQANVGSPGIGSIPHLVEAMLFRAAEVPWVHVVYPGGPPAVLDLIGGQIAALVLPQGILRAHRAAGRLRVLATSGARRSIHFPETPTLVEEGYRGLIALEWFAFFLPRGATPSTTESASKAVRESVRDPAVVTAFAEWGLVGASSTPGDLAARIAAEQRTWEPVVRSLGIRVE
jgi:tripartite-type tricarboxylate transporter receptor subunit TctC